MYESNKEFEIYKLSDIGNIMAIEIQGKFNILMNELSLICQQGREFSIVKTKLEEAFFFARKSMAMYIDNREDWNNFIVYKKFVIN